MEYFKSILHLLGIPHRPTPKNLRPRPAALELSELSKLPAELISHIVHFLSRESALSFSLCCRPIYFMFGSRIFENLAQTRECFEFLTLLARDLPNHVPCFYCEKLHAIEKAQQHIISTYRRNTTWLPCWKANYNFTFSDLHQNFSFTIFQMAMKRYRQGLDYSDFLNFLSCKETHYRDGYFKLYTALARIVNGSMILRERKIVMLPLSKRDLIQGNQKVKICPHIYLIWNLDSQGLYGIVESHRSLTWNIPRYDRNWQGLVRQCPYCRTDFSLEYEQFEGKVEAVFVTTWLDLGQGRSPMDYKWQSHVACCARQIWLSVELDRGSICAMFEMKEHLRFESIGFWARQDCKEFLRLLEHT